MNCQDFNEIVYDLADDQSSGERLAAATRRSALAHALACGRCAARLSQARLLCDGLIGVAEQTNHEMAQPRLKQSLMAAFDQYHLEQSNIAQANPEQIKLEQAKPEQAGLDALSLPAQKLPGVRRGFNWRPQWNWAMGAGMATAIILVIFAAVWNSRSSNNINLPKTDQAIIQPSPLPSPRPHAGVSPEPLPASLTGVSQTARKSEVAKAETKLQHRAPDRRRQSDRPTDRSFESDIATEYIPLTYTSAATAPKSGMVVRVEVPRSALLSMGLPINAERAKENVKADVLMGADGVALAIRLVNEGNLR